MKKIRNFRKIFAYLFFLMVMLSFGRLNAEEPKAVPKEKKANIIRLLKALGIMDTMERVKNTDPVMRDDKLRDEHLDDAYEMMITAYDKHFDNKDILELTVFFENPIWRKFREKSILMSKDMIETSKAIGEKNKQLIESEKDVPVSKMKADPASSLGKLLIKSKEGRTQGNLMQIRSAITKYYAKNEGQYPESLTGGFEKYLAPIPTELITGSNKVVNKFDGSGGWYYNVDRESKGFRQIYLNVEGKDSEGIEYSKY